MWYRWQANVGYSTPCQRHMPHNLIVVEDKGLADKTHASHANKSQPPLALIGTIPTAPDLQLTHDQKAEQLGTHIGLAETVSPPVSPPLRYKGSDKAEHYLHENPWHKKKQEITNEAIKTQLDTVAGTASESYQRQQQHNPIYHFSQEPMTAPQPEYHGSTNQPSANYRN